MLFEILTISISAAILFLVYFAGIKSPHGKTFLFSENFLNKADEILFGFVKFMYKLNSLLFHNISTFIARIPHKIVNVIHVISHATAKYTSDWIEKVTHKNNK